MLTLLAKLLHALNSENSTRQIAAAIALGFIAGLSPLLSITNLVILLIVLVVKVHLGSFILSLGFFSGISYLLSFLIVDVGEALLLSPSLEAMFTGLYQLTIFKLAHYHHTYALGAIVVGLALAIPMYFLANFIIKQYRVHLLAFFEKFRIIKALKASRFYQVYLKVSGQGDLV